MSCCCTCATAVVITLANHRLISYHFTTLQSVLVCRLAISLNMYAHNMCWPPSQAFCSHPLHIEGTGWSPQWELVALWPRASTVFVSWSGSDPSGSHQETTCHLHPHSCWLGFISWNPPGWIWCTVTGFKCPLFSLGLLRQPTHVLIFY